MIKISKKIVNLVDIKNKDVVEIGPGKGFLTDEIIKKKPKTLILIEKDNRLYEFLKNKYNKNKNIKIFNKDILKFNLEKIKRRYFHLWKLAIQYLVSNTYQGYQI